MHRRYGWTYSLILVFFLTACYEKNAKRSGELIPDMYSDEVVEEPEGDTLQFVDTFELISVATIYTELKKSLRTKVKLVYPEVSITDSLKTHDEVELLALSATYANWGTEVSNTALTKQGLEDAQTLLALAVNDSLAFQPVPDADSLHITVMETLETDSLINERVYYEAVMWLENLYLTLNSYPAMKNRKKFEALVQMQLENGSEMLDRLYYYQDYPPIANFSQHLLNILDCKHYTLDVTQLQTEVIYLRSLLFETEPTDK